MDQQSGGFWLSLLVTALVALAFQPLRRQVTRLANRLAFGSRAQPYEALADFSRRLAETPTTDAVLPAVAEAAGRAVSARRATATLGVAGGATHSAAWGDASAEGTVAHVVPVRHGSAILGRIEVHVPRGRPVSDSDERLLTALADQTAVAFRNTALEAELAEHVAELDRTTRELARSRARILEADDAARRALEAAIEREVMPHLVALPEGLTRCRTAVADGSPVNGIDLLVSSTNTALESLRELTRGVFPTQLAKAGLEPALRSLLGRGGSSPRLSVDPSAAGSASRPGSRLPSTSAVPRPPGPIPGRPRSSCPATGTAWSCACSGTPPTPPIGRRCWTGWPPPGARSTLSRDCCWSRSRWARTSRRTP